MSNLYNIDYPTCVFASFRLLNDSLENGVETLSIVRPKNKKIINKNAKMLKIPIIEIGYVSSGKGVFISEDSKTIRLEDWGWDHFR